MEHRKIPKLLNDSTVSITGTRQWIRVNDLWSGQHSVKKNVRLKNPMLRSDLFKYSNAYIVVKYLCNIWTSLTLPLTSCEVELDLLWTKDCVLIERHSNITVVNFVITSTTLYVSVVTLSIIDNIKLLENLKQGFIRTISLTIYRSEITTQPKNNNAGYKIDPTYRNIIRLFVLSLKNADNDPTRNSFVKFYMPLVEVKDFNASINNKPFLINPSKTNKKRTKNL